MRMNDANANWVKVCLFEFLNNTGSPFEYVENPDCGQNELLYEHGAIEFADYLVKRCKIEEKERIEK